MITTAEGGRPRGGPRKAGPGSPRTSRRVTLPDLDGFWVAEDPRPHRRRQAMTALVGYGIRTRLTPRQQQVVERYYHRGLTLEQTALELNLAPSTVCRHLQAARERLRRLAREAQELEPFLCREEE